MTTAETLTMTSATYLHTIPTGEEVTYEVSPSRWDSRCICVSYPADVDLSPYRSDDAYPMAAIERDWGAFSQCLAHGEDDGASWEVWQVKR
jgi:hypothetical protein